jgi:hypothetical protein
MPPIIPDNIVEGFVGAAFMQACKSWIRSHSLQCTIQPSSQTEGNNNDEDGGLSNNNHNTNNNNNM